MNLQDVIFPDYIKDKIFVELGTWCSSLNYRNYKEEEFDNGFYDFKESSISKKLDFTSLKNSFIENEIETIDLVLEDVRFIFLDYNINCSLKSIRSLYRELKTEKDIVFLNYIKNEVLELKDLSILLKDKLNNCSLDSAIFYCCAIYIDLLKVKEFLHSQYDEVKNEPVLIHEASEENDSNRDNSKYSAVQWMLYHWFLQEMKKKPRFIEKVKEIKALSKEYGVYWKTLQTKYNIILKSDATEGFDKKDLIKTEELIIKNYPNLINDFRGKIHPLF